MKNVPFRSGCRTPLLDSQSIRASFKFLLPSLIYAINNNIYLAGLLLVPPPIWIILCSFRTVVTACIYKFILKRDVSNLQFLGSFLIMGSIVVAKLGSTDRQTTLNIIVIHHFTSGDLLSSTSGNVIPVMALVFALVSSFNSVGVSVYQEQLFKVKNINL